MEPVGGGWRSSVERWRAVVARARSSSVERWRAAAARARSSPVGRWHAEAARAFQRCLDRAAPHTAWRWAGALVAAAAYALRVYCVQEFFSLSFMLLGWFFIIFLPPIDEPLQAPDGGGPPLPRPLREFSLWYDITKALCVAFVMTFFWVFDDFHGFWLPFTLLWYNILKAALTPSH